MVKANSGGRRAPVGWPLGAGRAMLEVPKNRVCLISDIGGGHLHLGLIMLIFRDSGRLGDLRKTTFVTHQYMAKLSIIGFRELTYLE